MCVCVCACVCVCVGVGVWVWVWVWVCASTKPLPMQTEWVVPPEAKAKYDTYFQGIDKDHDGIVSGDEARTLFMASNLPPKLLAHIW